MGTLAAQFLALTKGDRFWPPIQDTAPLIQASRYNLPVYYDAYYHDRSPEQVIITLDAAGAGVCVFTEGKLQRLATEVFRRHLGRESILRDLEEQFQNHAQAIDHSYERNTHARVAATPWPELLQELNVVWDTVRHLNGALWFSLYFDKPFLQTQLADAAKALPPTEVDAFWERAVVPATESFEKARHRDALRRIARDQPWEDFVEALHYSLASYLTVPTRVEARERLLQEYGSVSPAEAAKELATLDQEQAERAKVFTQWFETLPPLERSIVAYVQAIIRLRDARKHPLEKAITVLWRITERALREVDLDRSVSPYVLLDEVARGPGFLTGLRDSIRDRVAQGMTALSAYDGRVESTIGEAASDRVALEAAYTAQVQLLVSDVLLGQVGAPGRARGRVRVVLNASRAREFADGDVLVAGMTRPEYVPLMRKAAAIVTDEGGITCHAAIVSREMNKPCIIGTKIATQVLHDGDLVEVDAEQGVVTVLKRAFG